MNGEEHDQLIKLTTKITLLCSTVNKYEKNNREEHKEILKRIDRNYEKVEDKFLKNDECTDELKKNKLSTGMFKFFAGIIITVVIALTGFNMLLTSNTNAKIRETKLLLDNHVYYATAIYKKITGEEWSNQTSEAIQRAKKTYYKIVQERKDK